MWLLMSSRKNWRYAYYIQILNFVYSIRCLFVSLGWVMCAVLFCNIALRISCELVWVNDHIWHNNFLKYYMLFLKQCRARSAGFCWNQRTQIRIHTFSLKETIRINGSVGECLTQDRGASGKSLTGITVLCPWARHIYPCLELVQPWKTRPDIAEKCWLGRKESNQIKINNEVTPLGWLDSEVHPG